MRQQTGRQLIRLEVGGIPLGLKVEAGLSVPLDPALARFQAPGGRPPGFTLEVRHKAPALLPGAAVRFRCPMWTLRSSASGFEVEMPYARGSVRRLRVDPAWRRGVLGWAGRPPGKTAWPFRQPSLEWLWMHLLAHRGGIPLHAAGVIHAGKTLAFAGRSGAGKSTLEAFWQAHFPGDEALSDDRMVLRRNSGRPGWTAWGTPWGGRGNVIGPGSAPLAAVLVLRKSGRLALRRLAPRESLAALLPCHLLPYWLPGLSERSVGRLGLLVREVPVWEFSFPGKPSAAVWLEKRLRASPPPSRRRAAP